MATIDLSSNLASSSYRLIDYEEAKIVPGIVDNTFFLVVSGTAPCRNMKVELSPLVYIDCPGFWDIELLASLPGGVCLEGVCSFMEIISLTGITGSEGIRLIGVTKREKFDVPRGCTC